MGTQKYIMRKYILSSMDYCECNKRLIICTKRSIQDDILEYIKDYIIKYKYIYQLGYQDIVLDQNVNKKLFIEPLRNIGNNYGLLRLSYDLIHKFDLELSNIENLPDESNALYFDYDNPETYLEYIHDTNLVEDEGYKIKKYKICNTRKGYHMHVFTTNKVEDKLSIYRKSLQDVNRVRVMQREYSYNSNFFQKNIMDKLMSFYDILFTEKYIIKRKQLPITFYRNYPELKNIETFGIIKVSGEQNVREL